MEGLGFNENSCENFNFTELLDHYIIFGFYCWFFKEHWWWSVLIQYKKYEIDNCLVQLTSTVHGSTISLNAMIVINATYDLFIERTHDHSDKYS